VIASKQPIAGADVARHYDELDAFYRDVWGEHVHHGLWLRGDESREVAVRQLVDLVATEAAIGTGTRVIDIGCGYGATARMLAEERGARVTAITISAAQHAIATRLGTSSFSSSSSSSPRARRGFEAGSEKDVDEEKDEDANPCFLLGDWLTNDLPDASCDAAISIESSEHMPDKPRFFAEAHRVLRPSGRLAICAWLAAERPTSRQERWLIEPICREGRMPHLGTETDYRQLAAVAGFTVQRVQDVTRQIARTWPMIVRIFLLKLLHRPAYLRFLLDRHAHNRIFALTTVRLWIAFRTGAMRYAVFTLVKSSSST
jgi:tocopherol O-methyltransferase